jgi:hypothetical protein
MRRKVASKYQDARLRCVENSAEQGEAWLQESASPQGKAASRPSREALHVLSRRLVERLPYST